MSNQRRQELLVFIYRRLFVANQLCHQCRLYCTIPEVAQYHLNPLDRTKSTLEMLHNVPLTYFDFQLLEQTDLYLRAVLLYLVTLGRELARL